MLSAPPLEDHLRTMLGPEVTFRDGQREAIEAVSGDGARALVVQRTGWGKSLVYWIATRVRRDTGHGPTLIVSPLLSLMRNQIAMAARLGLEAVTINSGNVGEWREIEGRLERNEIDVLLISPERLANEGFTSRVLPAIERTIGLLVIDEAHCISDWGHDFRPDYQRISRLLPLLGPTVPVLATTATANDRVVEDVAAQLGAHSAIIRGPLARDTLRLDAIPLADQAERLAWLAENIPRLPGSGIIYCLTVADTERVATWLRGRGIDARAYNGPMAQPDREALEDALIANEMKALVATVALGMGFDKPDLGFVVHYQRPGSAIAYYQQVGRAGRAVERAYGILLSGREDDEIADYFLRTAFPPADRMRELLGAFDGVESASIGRFQRAVNLTRGQLDQALKQLELDGAVTKSGGRWSRTAEPWAPDEERIARVTATRRAELEQMQAYVTTDGCRMAYLTGLLDDPATAPCGRCANDVGKGMSHVVDGEVVRAAIDYLRRSLRPIEPRKRWLEADGASTGTTIADPNAPGIALCVAGDAGWGREIVRARGGVGRFPDGLVVAATRAIRDQWRPDVPPEWVTSVPSRTAAGLVRGFAEALAAELGLPYVDCLTSSADRPPQAAMQNSVLQLENARAKLGIDRAAVRPGAVLLVDDLVDSRWTLTVAGSLLRASGSGTVLPFTLAQASARDS
ncbi:MAG TPA: RecQ family ATP-dependent DNA helicase [Candidatus Limnocylindrales bacterium]|nr:RecQ family ATP-dependent DNA helicase [Candidatus Limnocylindrales bacterium]